MYNLAVQISQTGDLAATRRLVASCKDIDERDGHGRTALHWAHGAAQAAILLAAGADPDLRDREGHVPLHSARDAEHARMLLCAGATVPDDLRNDTRVVLAQAGIATERSAAALSQGAVAPPGRRRRA